LKLKLQEPGGSAAAAAPSAAPGTADDAGQGLAEVLCRIVADPAQVDWLHQSLGPFCHEGRNILNVLKMSLYLARRHDALAAGDGGVWNDVEQHYQAVEEFFDRLQMLWRPISLAPVPMSLSLLLEDRRPAWDTEFAARGRILEMSNPGAADAGQYDPHWLGRALDGFVVWRAGAGLRGGEARLNWWTDGGRFHLEWREPPGESDSRSPQDRPEPLALPLLTRVIAAHGGVLDLLAAGGGHVRMSWPQVVRRAD
jgi:hypothetical protein